MSRERITGTLEKVTKPKVSPTKWRNYFGCIVDGEERNISVSPDYVKYELEEGMEVHLIKSDFEGKWNTLASTFGEKYGGSSGKPSTTSSKPAAASKSSGATETWTIDRIKKINHEYEGFVFRVENDQGDEGLLFKKKDDPGFKEGDTLELEVSTSKGGEKKVKVPYNPPSGNKNKGEGNSSKSSGGGGRGSNAVNTFLFGSTTKLIGDCVAAGITSESEIKTYVRMALTMSNEIEDGTF